MVWRFLPDLQAIVAGAAAGFFLQRWFLPRYRSLLAPVLGFVGLGALLNIRLLFGAVPAQWEIGVRGLAFALAAAFLWPPFRSVCWCATMALVWHLSHSMLER